MGYIENVLPKSLARLGHDVHLVTSTTQVYYNDPNYDKIYLPYLGEKVQPAGVRKIEDFYLHRLPYKELMGKLYLIGIKKLLNELKPDIVQSLDVFSFPTVQVYFHQFKLKFKLFTANHIHASVFPIISDKNVSLKHKLFFYFSRTLPSKFISKKIEFCYAIAPDAAEIAEKYYSVPKEKIKIVSLGVDTDFFNKPDKNSLERQELRNSLGISNQDIVCIYTGRFTEGKNPLCLAQAIDKLAEMGEPFKGLFMGNGPQAQEIQQLKSCLVHPFVPYQQLPKYYKLADIGVWPRQESTSMLDAAACGLPIIISNQVQTTERIDGNGLSYTENDVEDMIKVLLKLTDNKLRDQMSQIGVEKIVNNYSWDILARGRAVDYENSLKTK